MSHQVVPFEGAPLPSYLRNTTGAGNLTEIAASIVTFPVISIKGKVFTIKRGAEKMLITKPGAPDEPASHLEVVILGIGPDGSACAKQFYNTGFVEGSEDKPLCYSNDGVEPAADAQEPQSAKCATCPHNVFGSKITESGAKSKACADSKRLAVAAPDNLEDPMLLRVPAKSLAAFRQFAKVLSDRGVGDSQAVIAKIGFDHTVAHQQLTFRPVGFVDSATYIRALDASKADNVYQITGKRKPEATGDEEAKPAPVKPTLVKPVDAPAPAAAAAPAKKTTTLAPAVASVAAAPAPAPAVKKTTTLAPAAAKAPVPPASKVKAPPVAVESFAAVDDALDEIEFDD